MRPLLLVFFTFVRSPLSPAPSQASAYVICLSIIILRFLMKYEKQLSFMTEHLMAFSDSLSYLSGLEWYAQAQEPTEFTRGVP